jgi:hypothetical protein
MRSREIVTTATFVAAVLALLLTGPAGAIDPSIREATLKAGQELKVTTDCETHDEVVIMVKNTGDGPCSAWVEGLKNGKPLSDEDFGTRAERTLVVEKNYKKIKGFDCITDEVVVHLTEGMAEIRVSQVTYE